MIRLSSSYGLPDDGRPGRGDLMKRIVLAVLVAVVPVLGSATSAHAKSPAYVWSVGPAPFGPNVVAAAHGRRGEMTGQGVIRGGGAVGGGQFHFFNANGVETASGTWTAEGPATARDYGQALR